MPATENATMPKNLKPTEHELPATEPVIVTEIDEKDKKIAELQDAYLRCLADQENLRVRTRRDIQQASDFGIRKFAKDLLDTVDILGMALSSIPEHFRNSAVENISNDAAKHLQDLYTGVSMTESGLIKTLKRHGVEQFGEAGDVFDPNMHQALYQIPDPSKQVGTVIQVQMVGYTLKGSVLRPAQVGIVAEPPQ